MLRIKFKYRDKMTFGKWHEQECFMSSVEECKKHYGLDTDPDVEYEIISVEEIKEEK